MRKKVKIPGAKYPGWRTMTSAERYNARKDAIFAHARELQAKRDAEARNTTQESTP